MITLTLVLHQVPQNGLLGADKGSIERNVGKNCPTRTANVLGTLGFRWGRESDSLSRAGPLLEVLGTAF